MVSNGQSFEELFEFLVADRNIDQSPVSLKALYDHIKATNAKRILEIGINKGGTAKMWQHLLPEDGVVVAVDLGLFSERWVDLSGTPPIKIVIGDSHESPIVNRVKAFADVALFDAVFIDGDHSYEGVKADYENYAPMVRSGGIISFHDHGHGPILKFWNELQVPGKVILSDSLTIGMFKKV